MRAALLALYDVVELLTEIRDRTKKMAGKRKRPKTEAELERERGLAARQQNLRELAEGRAEREWRAQQGKKSV